MRGLHLAAHAIARRVLLRVEVAVVVVLLVGVVLVVRQRVRHLLLASIKSLIGHSKMSPTRGVQAGLQWGWLL